MSDLGIGDESIVVAYDDEGGVIAGRLVWMLRATGHQAAILDGIVQPALEAFFREHPDRRRVGALGVGVEALAAEIDRIRQILTGGGALGDVQLFSQLKALGEIKAALASLNAPRARELEGRVTQLLEASFRSGRFAQL